jgi:hypothetical protein
MANLDRPQGFRLQGKPLRVQPYTSGAACYQGDLVKMSSDGFIDPCSAGDLILGVCMGYASTSGVSVMVADHPDQQIVGQVAASEIDAAGDLFNTADIVATAGDSTYKISRHEIDGSSQSGSATAQLRLLRALPATGNALGQYVDVVCQINEHQFGAAQANAAVGV